MRKHSLWGYLLAHPLDSESSSVRCTNLRNLVCSYISPRSPLPHSIPAIPLFLFSLSFLHPVFFAIKTCHPFDSDALTSLCSPPCLRTTRSHLRRNLIASPFIVTQVLWGYVLLCSVVSDFLFCLLLPGPRVFSSLLRAIAISPVFDSTLSTLAQSCRA